MRRNYKAPLMAALGECGFNDGSGISGRRITFTHVRKGTGHRSGHRRLKLWIANDVWNAPQATQVRLEAALKKHYGSQYLGAYFIDATVGKSLCLVLDKES